MQYARLFEMATRNKNYRVALFTNKHSQLVLMSLKPGEDLISAVYPMDQVLVLVWGEGKASINGEEQEMTAGDAVCIPADYESNFINTGKVDVKLFVVYSPPEFKWDTVEASRSEAFLNPYRQVESKEL